MSDSDEPIIIESSDSDTDSECSDWDHFDVITSKPNKTEKLVGYHLMHPECSDDPALPAPKRKCTNCLPELRSELTTENFITEIKEASAKGVSRKTDNYYFYKDPFDVYVMKNLFDDKQFLNEIKKEFNEVEWNIRWMDLYEFFQSEDLKHSKSKHLTLLYNYLIDTVMPYVGSITGEQLSHVSATCSVYTDTDYLLVHDDQQGDRVVAFILYLTENETKQWSDDYGGALELFSCDDDGQPNKPVCRILPENNQFVFFPVTNKSYHQVSEVTNREHCRMSINGWFHGPKKNSYQTPVLRKPTSGLYSDVNISKSDTEYELREWVNQDYLHQETVERIVMQIEEYSEISLKDFFKEKVLSEVLSCLENDSELKWERSGPPNRRTYDVLKEDSLPPTLQRFVNLFKSTTMFTLLHKYSDLDIDKPNAKMRYELQRWSAGCVSLLSDYNWSEKNELDVLLYLGCTESAGIIGGETQYVAIDEEVQNALITIEPEENVMNIVFRDTARITKYVSKYTKAKCFYLFICSYSE